MQSQVLGYLPIHFQLHGIALIYKLYELTVKARQLDSAAQEPVV
jgi:hypothetical protein